jgi:hypothetical protein
MYRKRDRDQMTIADFIPPFGGYLTQITDGLRWRTLKESGMMDERGNISRKPAKGKHIQSNDDIRR